MATICTDESQLSLYFKNISEMPQTQQSNKPKPAQKATGQLVTIVRPFAARPKKPTQANRPYAPNPLYRAPKVKQPQSLMRRLAMDGPTVGRNSVKGRSQQDIIEFDEFVSEITGTSSSTVPGIFKFPLNPGIPASFPEGSVEAALWTEWRMAYCEYYYRREVSEFATGGTTGKVIIACDYNAANPSPTTKQQLEIMAHSDGLPSESMALRLDPKSVNRSDAKYIRTGGVPAGGDVKTYDGGNVYVATMGNASTGTLGELRVRYKFIVTKPTLLNASSGQSPKVTSVFSQHTPTALVTATPKAIQWDSAQSDPLAAGTAIALGVLTPPAGSYLVRVQATFSDSVNESLLTVLEIQKNGASLPVKCTSRVTNDNAGNIENNSQCVFAVVNLNGSDTLSIVATATGAAGILTCIADGAQLVLTPA